MGLSLKIGAGILLIAFGLNTAYAVSEEKVIVESSYLVGKQKAEKLNLPYLVQFTADWCRPCDWLEETTLNDPGIAERVNRDYIFIRVNVEEFEGYSLKQFYEINSLPTMLVFKPDHRLVGKFEGSYSKEELAVLLENYLTKDYGEIQVRPDRAGVINRDPPEGGAGKNAVIEDDIPRLRTLDQDMVETAWRIQVGAYGNSRNAAEKLSEVKSMLQQPCHIFSEERPQGPLYRVYTGLFQSKADAERFLRQLRAMGVDGLVKKVSLAEKT